MGLSYEGVENTIEEYNSANGINGTNWRVNTLREHTRSPNHDPYDETLYYLVLERD